MGRPFVKLTRILTGMMAGLLAMTIAATDVVTTSDLAAANTGATPSITLNGTVVEGSPDLIYRKRSCHSTSMFVKTADIISTPCVR